MRFRNTLILAVVVALVGAYVLWVERPAMEREEQESRLLDFEREKVTGLTLDSPKGKIEIVRSEPSGWKITTPRETGADQVAVDGIVGAIEGAAVKKRLDEVPTDLGPFGLHQPESTVVVNLSGGSTRKLAFGKKAPIGGSAYVQRDDEPAVLLTDDTVRATTQRTLDELRDKTILTFADSDVRGITIGGVEGQPTVLTRDGNEWRITSPVPARADAAQVRSMLASLRSVRATGFVDDAGSPPDSKYQLTPPRVTVELVLAPDDAKRTLLVGGATDDPAKKEIFAQALPGDTVYVVGSHLFSVAAKRVMDFRDKTVLAFDKAKVRAVTSERADGQGFRIEKKDDAWSLAEAGTAGVKEFIAGRFADDLRELKGTDIASETGPRPEFGLDRPAIKLVVDGADGPLGTIRVSIVGDGADKKIYAAADGSQTVHLLQEFVFQRVDKKRGDLLMLPTPTPVTGASPVPGAAKPAQEPDDEAAALDDEAE